MTETVRIPPTTKILRLIAEIEFRPWQCLAELIDNSFDEFLAIKRSGTSWNEPLQVVVQLPTQNDALSDAVVVVSDNGRGMTLEQATGAVSAGYTSRDPLENLGLFGMGFNVATARLGGVTRFMTTREGDPEWVGIEIDVDNMATGFEAPVIRAPKISPSEHGTRVEISRLRQLAETLLRPATQTAVRKQFASVYSHLLSAEQFGLTVNGIPVSPWRHCVWSTDRYVTRGGTRIPAILEIDETLGERSVCSTCGRWQAIANTECEHCGKTPLERRERRVSGWIGIARELDGREYGIDFLRNGRKILRFDKEIFRWQDPDEPPGSGEVEYPIEVPANQGRIVGEIHLDHVRVSYTKDAFDSTDPAWWAARRILRGDGPLQPQKAKAHGYPRNDSPLGRLYHGYRRNDPGKEGLMPGTGSDRRARLSTSDWVKKFYEGDEDYQTDAKWWEAVVQHDALIEAKNAAKAAAEAAPDDDPTREFREDVTPDDETEEDEAARPAEPELTDEQRVEQLLAAAIPLPELDGEFSATGVGSPAMRLAAYASRGIQLKIDGRRVPVWITGHQGGRFVAFVDLDHGHFRHFDDSPEDIVLMEIAQNLLTRAKRAGTVTVGSVYMELKDRHLSAHAIDPGKLVPEAGSLMRDIQERMVGCVRDNPERPWRVLAEPERHLTTERIVETLKTTDVDSVVYEGEYLRFVPVSVVPRIIEDWPEAFFDGSLFNRPYADVKTAGAQRTTVATVTGYLSDIAWLASNPEPEPRERLIRARLSLKLLPDELI